MINRLRALWGRLQESLWFVPGLLTLASAVLAFATVEIDRAYWSDQPDSVLLFGGGAEAARGVLAAVAGGLITVTGVVFSITIVALQLASTQYSPRILRNFTSDRGNQLVLGVFIGTFTYALLVLRTVVAPDEEIVGFVPSLSVTVAVGLTLVSIGFFIYFIDHAARSIQASVIIGRIRDDTAETIDRRFPDPVDSSEKPSGGRIEPPSDNGAITARKAGYLQAVDEGALKTQARESALMLRVEVQLGRYVMQGTTLARAWPSEALDDEAADGIRSAFNIGDQRTPHQDVERGILELADIALKGLSPGINDPTTATICIDRLADLLVIVGNRAWPDPVRRDDDGEPLFIAFDTPFEELVGMAFDQIRHFSAGQPIVLAHLLNTIARAAELLPPPRREPFRLQTEAILADAERSIADQRGLRTVQAAGRAALRATHGLPADAADPHATPGD